MTFAELKTEFFARGTDYLEEDAAGIARAARWLNQAYREICNLQPWPFLTAEVVGSSLTLTQGGAGLPPTGGLAVPGLRRIRYVTDGSTGAYPGAPLKKVLMEDLLRDGYDLTLSGSPDYYYVLNGTAVASYPLGSSIRVGYIKRTDPMVADADEPLFDEEYHDLIVDRAMIKAYKDSDNFEAASSLREEYNAGLAAMAEDYMLDSRDVQYIDVNPYDG